jgi:protein-disulfide isomerase
VEQLSEKRYTSTALGIAAQLVRSSIVALAGAISIACRDSSARGNTGPDPAGETAQPTAAASVDVVLPGVDSSAMTPRERHEWSSLVLELLAPCPNVPVSVAQCVQEGRACATCGQAAKWVAHLVRDGSSKEQIRHAYKQRFDPAGVRPIPVDGSPSRGPEDAPVVIVEFADFECPHCRLAVSLLDSVLAAHPDKVRLIYKSYTLSFHQRGEPAARAALAAGLQGKFWEMEHLLFDRQEHLDPSDLDRYAVLLRLDVPKWKADMDSPGIRERIEHDHTLGEDLKLKGTPAIYINGRELDVEADESLEGRVAAELGVAPHATGDAPADAVDASPPTPPVASGSKPR